MLSLGIDVGHRTAKAVLVEDGLVAGKVILRVAGSVEGAAMAVTESLSKLLGLEKEEISQRVFVTGVGREKVSHCHGRPTEMASHQQGVHHWFSSAHTVADMGAEGIRVSRCDSQGRLLHFILNDRCGAGTGVFLETVAEMMGLGLEEIWGGRRGKVWL